MCSPSTATISTRPLMRFSVVLLQLLLLLLCRAEAWAYLDSPPLRDQPQNDRFKWIIMFSGELMTLLVLLRFGCIIETGNLNFLIAPPTHKHTYTLPTAEPQLLDKVMRISCTARQIPYNPIKNWKIDRKRRGGGGWQDKEATKETNYFLLLNEDWTAAAAAWRHGGPPSWSPSSRVNKYVKIL